MQRDNICTTVIKVTANPRDVEIRESWPFPLSAEQHVKAGSKECPAQVHTCDTGGTEPSSDSQPGLRNKACFSAPGTGRCCLTEGREGVRAEPKEKICISSILGLESSPLVPGQIY